MTRTCARPGCGHEFEPTVWQQTYCCTRCRMADYQRRHVEIAAAPALGTCAICGDTFEMTRAARLYCSTACCQVASRARNVEAIRARQRKWYARQKALLPAKPRKARGGVRVCMEEVKYELYLAAVLEQIT